MEKSSNAQHVHPRLLLGSFAVFYLLLNLSSIPFHDGEVTPTFTQDVTSTSASVSTSAIQDAETSIATFTDTPLPAVFPADTVDATGTVLISDESLRGEFASDEILVRFHWKTSRETIEQCVQSLGAVIESEIEALSVLLLKVQSGRIAENILNLRNCPDMLYAEPNYLAGIADTIPSDPNWNLQYGLVNIHAPQGWDFATGSSGVTIAIVDTGVDLTHPDLAGKIVGGYDFVNNDANPNDDNGHGTHVAGIAAASSNNGTGIAGVSWGARIMPVKVLNAGGGGTFANVAAGIAWAADNGAQVINLSLGGTSASTVLEDAVNYAYNKGVVLVAASGNTGANFVLYPAHYPNVIAVAATDSTNTRAGFSNFGPEIDLVAPGVSIYSTFWGGSYTYLSGTSSSTPFVSGLAAILRGIPGYGSPDVIALRMESTALDLGTIGFDDFYGYGLIQMDTALQLSPPPTSTYTASHTLTPTVSSTTRFAVSSTYLPEIPATNLPTLTATSTMPLTATLTLTPTNLPQYTPTINISDTAEVKALENPEKIKTDTTKTTNWFLPCCGSSLILLGILLFWMAYQNNKEDQKGQLRF